jgi:hypothetical protein
MSMVTFSTILNADQMAFKVRADDRGGKRIVTFEGVEFVRRFLLHVLPSGLKRIRHDGLLAPSKAQSLAQARSQMQMQMQMQMQQSNPVVRSRHRTSCAGWRRCNGTNVRVARSATRDG